MSAGPTDEGQFSNTYSTIICDPGDRKAESLWPGIFYTAVSRGTTLGRADGLGSAVYFLNDIPSARLEDLTIKQNSTCRYHKVVVRDRWIQYQKRHLVAPLKDVGSTLLWAAKMSTTGGLTAEWLEAKTERYSVFVFKHTKCIGSISPV